MSGKPVPPRPSVRHRVTSREAESHAGPHWPGIVREPLGEWELRFEQELGERLRKRANSCLAMGDPGVALEDAAAQVLDFYTARERTPMVQVEVGSDADRWFDAAGWAVVPGGDALFLLGSVARARRLLGPAAGATLAVDGPRARADVDDRARGSAGLHDDWLGLHGLHVAPGHRRQGLARAVMAALLEWGAEQGATTVWLHVETGNEPAIALYESMGLAEHHALRYLAAPGKAT
jgi:ribosomal protein S18 acetylase RimI-like enzyme